MPLGIRSGDYLSKHQRQVHFDVGYVVLGKYQEMQWFLFYECGVEGMVSYLEQRSLCEWGWVGVGRGGEGAESKHMHVCLLEPVPSNRV